MEIISFPIFTVIQVGLRFTINKQQCPGEKDKIILIISVSWDFMKMYLVLIDGNKYYFMFQ